ncbi:MAG TPA: hypothetical protein VHM02_07755, partial [Thermoanaerobaculia bacterium]|nr:hypothetical protein [Thermoanaerobaculia bacterium]
MRTAPARRAALAVLLLAAATALPAAAEPARPPDLGEVDLATSARSPEARESFRRGVAALHSFWYDEAADAFRAAWEAEPGFAMAAWGEAMTCNHPIWNEVDLECGRAALARLGATAEERAAAAPTARERAYLAAVEALFAPGDADKEARDTAYERAVADLAAAHPDDLDAAAFHALALQGLVYAGHLPGDERFPALMRSAALLEPLFDREPRHPGVLHYLIHAYDDPVHAPLGLRAAETYARVAPAAHHALHMPSHIFVQLGRWDDVVASNEEAWAASVAWQERRGHGVDRRDFHSLSWRLYGELQQGRRRAAAETLETARRSLAESGGHARIAGALERMAARYRIETGEAPPETAEVAAHPAHPHAGDAASPPDPAHAAHPEEDGAVLFARGLAALAAGDPAAALALAERLAEEEGAPSRVMARELEGLALVARGDAEAGLAELREAAELEAAMPPPSGP